MSFASIVKKVGSTLLGIEHGAAPIAEAILPQYAGAISQLDGWAVKIQNTITTLEQNPVLDGQGQVKSDAVIADFESGLDLTNAALAHTGQTMSYDKVELQNAINSLVAGYNSLAKVKASMKVVPLPATAVAP